MQSRLSSPALAGLAFLIFAAPAAAQKKDDLATEEAKTKGVFKPEEKIDALEAAEAAEAEKLVTATEKKLSRVRQRQLREMRSILKKNPLYRKKADLLFRIAEKEWAEAKYRWLLERKDYEKQYEAFLNGTLKKRPEEPEAQYGRALTEYKKLLKEFPNYKRLDEVMYYLGRGLIAAKKQKEGASYMLRLTKEFPKSRFLTRAYLAVAEYYFDNDLLFAAKTNYLKVLKDKKAAQYPYALFKLGYVYYNLKEYRDGINAFQEVVSLSRGKDKRKIYFTNQAYSGLVLNYLEIPDGWKEARDYYRKQGGRDLEINYLSKMGSGYRKQDKSDEEIAVYEYLITAEKTGKKVPEYAEYITAAWKKLEDIDKTDQVITRFLGVFDSKSSWYAVNKENEEAMTRARQYREEQTDWLIGWYHTKAQELEKLSRMDRANEYYKRAAKYYELYLAAFPKSKDLYEKEFFLAEIYFFQTKQWDLAAQHYKSVVERDKKGKYSRESAYAVILSKEEKMADAGLIKRPKRSQKRKGKKRKKRKAEKAGSVEYYSKKEVCKGGDPKTCFRPVPKKALHPTEVEFVKACAYYTDLYPKDKEVPFVSFRAAEIYIKAGHYEEGVERLEVIIEHHSKHEYAGHAAATLFDANYRLRRWDQMERWGRYMLKTRNYKVLSKKQLRSVIAVSINEYAQQLAKEGKKDEAVEQMLRFVKEFPKHDKAAIALFNAAAFTEQAERTEQAIDLYEMLIKRYKKSPQATEAHFVLGALYESQTDFERAAGYFEKMASFPDVPQMADSLYNAGAIRVALEENKKAIRILETYVKKFPARDDVGEIYLQIAGLYEKEGRYKKAHRTYDAYVKKFGKSRPATVIGVYLAKAKAYQKAGGKRARRLASKQLAKAARAYKKLKGKDKDDKATKAAAAEARFLEAEYIHQDFDAVVVAFPQRVLRKTLVKKAELLGKAEKVYFEVAEFKSHQVSAGAFFRIGQQYYLFAKSLFDLPVPEELTEDEKIIYRAELDDKAAPLQEKAIDAARNALKLAHKNRVYNKWSRESAALLVKLSPDAFPVLDDNEVNADWTVPATFSTAFITDPAGDLKQMLKKEKAKKEAGSKEAAAQEGSAKKGDTEKAKKDDAKKAKKDDAKKDDVKKGKK